MQKQNKYQVIVTLAAGLLIISYIFKIDILIPISTVILLASAASSWIAEKISWAWMKFAEGIGFVMQRVILSVIYFLLLTPIVFLYKLTKKNVLQLKKINGSAGSYYETRDHAYVKRDLQFPW